MATRGRRGRVRAGAGGGAVVRWAIWAPHEQAIQTDSLSRPPSSSRQRLVFAYKSHQGGEAFWHGAGRLSQR